VSAVHLSSRARRDLLDIWLTIARDSEQAANRLYKRLEQRLKILETFPEAGPARPEIHETARSLTEPPYLILYRIVDHGVQIVRVLHGARHIDRALFREN